MAAFSQVKLSTSLSDTLLSTSGTVANDKTYDPVGYVAPGVARWEDRSGGIAVGFPSITMSVRPPTKASRMYKVMAKVSIPTLETISNSTVSGILPAPQKAYDCQCVMEFILPERSTSTERINLISLVQSLFGTTLTASDGDPSVASGTPLRTAVSAFDRPF